MEYRWTSTPQQQGRGRGHFPSSNHRGPPSQNYRGVPLMYSATVGMPPPPPPMLSGSEEMNRNFPVLQQNNAHVLGIGETLVGMGTPPGYSGVNFNNPGRTLDPLEFPVLANPKTVKTKTRPKSWCFTNSNAKNFPVQQRTPMTMTSVSKQKGFYKTAKEAPCAISAIPKNVAEKATNTPTMMNDPFGVAKLVTSICEPESEFKNMAIFPPGLDLNSLGLNGENAVNGLLWPSFAGPFAEGPLPPEDKEHPVPCDYKMSNSHCQGSPVSFQRKKLPPLKLDIYNDDLLFYLFYTYTGDALQLLAASELFNRHWRYHKEEKVWMTRLQNVAPLERGFNFEKGAYLVFDPACWKKKVVNNFYLDFSKLEQRPDVPSK